MAQTWGIGCPDGQSAKIAFSPDWSVITSKRGTHDSRVAAGPRPAETRERARGCAHSLRAWPLSTGVSAGVLIQFPFYAAIFGMIVGTRISDWLARLFAG